MPFFNNFKDTFGNPFSNDLVVSNPKKINKTPGQFVDDELTRLEECFITSDRYTDGISFPTISITSSFNQRIVEHNIMDRNGAILESTGFGAIKFDIEAPFCNGLVKGKYESWEDLYPKTYNDVISMLSNRKTFVFNHPEYGLKDVKCSAFKTVLDPNYRNGVVLSFSLTVDSENIDDDNNKIIEVILSESNALAQDLDNKIASIIPPIDPNFFKLSGFNSFLDGINKIGSFADQFGLLQSQAFGIIDRMIGSINRLTERYDNSVTQLGNAPDRLIASLLKIKNNTIINAFEADIKPYRTSTTMSLNQLSKVLNNDISDLIKLNIGINRFPIIPKNTVVMYLDNSLIPKNFGIIEV